MNSETYKTLFYKKSVITLLLLSYLISINILAGYIAVWLKFPSLWGNSQIFLDYAMPFGLTWALAHWPSMVLLSIPLLLLPHWNAKSIQRFRLICLCLFFILIYGVIEKIPFALFPAVDLFVALFFSLIIVPPDYKENPKLVISLLIFFSFILFSCSYYIYSKWQHQVPEIIKSNLMSGLFELKEIKVDTNYKKMIFSIELKQKIPQENVCQSAIKMSSALFNSYQFDKSYKKIAYIIFNSKQTGNREPPYPLGELEQYEEKGILQIGCYLKYK
ncbi:MAG: hypothetical protein HND53_04235 [Proteobacteria bacterium]|nr:hypothetical protein [Pseudomonadota bacterium]NOG59685.1 hypothetical protein [Pseudomonadota bacterium]